ncbi:MAG: hypothetical protein JW996_07100 [Candidatus Cloacimonetes bacterium]|nr:hypothetical protein [Candidatus Cloacimonadota bacterium]
MRILLIILLLCVFSLSAQEYSTAKAALLSAAIPGGGELYSGQYSKAGVFLAVELATWISYFRLDQETQWAIKSYKQYANSRAGVPQDSPEDYYQLIQDYFSSDSYNDNVYLFARNIYLSANSPYYDEENYELYLANNLIPPEEAWHWQTTGNWMKYRDIRAHKQDLEIYTKFTFAAAFLNRIISVIDTFISVRKLNREHRYLGKVSIEPDWNKKGMKLSYEYKF